MDIDPQANCTSGLGISPEDFELSLTTCSSARPRQGRRHTTSGKGSLFFRHHRPGGSGNRAASVISRETRLRRHLRSLDSFDVAIVDCPPSLGMLTINALVASDKLIIPIQCEYYALEGVGQLSKTVGLVRDSLNPELEISGVLLTMYDSRTRLSNEVAEEVRRQFGSVAFSSVIPRNVRLSEAPSHAAPIGYYDPSSTGAQAYGDLAREVSGLWLKRAH